MVSKEKKKLLLKDPEFVRRHAFLFWMAGVPIPRAPKVSLALSPSDDLALPHSLRWTV